MGQDAGKEGICAFYQKAENKADKKGIGQLLGVHVQKPEEQRAGEGSFPFAQELITAQKDAAGKCFFQKCRDHCDGKQRKDQAGLLDAADRLFHRVREEETHQVGKQTHDRLNGNCKEKDNEYIFPVQWIQTQGFPKIFSCMEKIENDAYALITWLIMH